MERRREMFWLAGASLLAAWGLALVFAAKTQDFTELQDRLNRGELLNLNQAADPQQVSAILEIFTAPSERDSAAERIWNYIQQHRPLPNIGAIAKLGAKTLPFSKLKSLLIVRTPGEFLRIYTLWSLLCLPPSGLYISAGDCGVSAAIRRSFPPCIF